MALNPKQLVRHGYDAVSLAYRADQVDEATERRYAGWLSLLDPHLASGCDVLEIGCGCGLPAGRLLADKYNLTGIDISPVQIRRARTLVPEATFHCADITEFPLPADSYHGVVSLYAIIHVPITEQPQLIRNVATALRSGGALLMTVGHRKWTGTEPDWLGVAGATMYWSQEDEAAYCRWIADAGLDVRRCEFVPEGEGGHSLILAAKP